MRRFVTISSLAIALVVLTAISKTRAADIIQGSGVNANLSATFQRDNFWNIVALPTTNTIGSPTMPYQAYVPRTVPGVWYGGNSGPSGSQGGYQADGNNYYWISPSSTDASIASGNYNWIAAQTFNITTSGTYAFNFYASGDNAIKFFIDGTIDQSIAQNPDITGGTQIGGSFNNFTQISQYTGNATLSAGTHTAYMVLYDFGGSTGALIGQSTFAVVPEPSSYALAAIGSGVMALLARRRRAAKA